jgi:hypothetical protein
MNTSTYLLTLPNKFIKEQLIKIYLDFIDGK